MAVISYLLDILINFKSTYNLAGFKILYHFPEDRAGISLSSFDTKSQLLMPRPSKGRRCFLRQWTLQIKQTDSLFVNKIKATIKIKQLTYFSENVVQQPGESGTKVDSTGGALSKSGRPKITRRTSVEAELTELN